MTRSWVWEAWATEMNGKNKTVNNENNPINLNLIDLLMLLKNSGFWIGFIKIFNKLICKWKLKFKSGEDIFRNIRSAEGNHFYIFLYLTLFPAIFIIIWEI